MVIWCFPRWNRFWTMYITLMFLWWLFFVNREATLWSVSFMRSSRVIKCFSLGSKLSKSAILVESPLHLRFRIQSGIHHKMRFGIEIIMCLILCTNLLTKTDFPLSVGPKITLVNGCTHGMKWSGSFPSEPKTKMDYWFSKYNRVLLHYSVVVVVVVVYTPLSVVVVVVDTDELFHAYFFYVSP